VHTRKELAHTGCTSLYDRQGAPCRTGRPAVTAPQVAVPLHQPAHRTGRISQRDPSTDEHRDHSRWQPAIPDTGYCGHSPSRPGQRRPVRSWPLLVLALPAAVTVWSGWVGIGQMTGFGQVHLLPGLWGSVHLNTAITLPVGVEAYAAYALRAWLASGSTVSARTRRFARWSAITSLALGMAGQVAYHLLTQAHTTHAPWGITTAVSCLPVLVLGMGAALTHLLHADTHHGPADQTAAPGPDHAQDHTVCRCPRKDHTATTLRPGLLVQAETAAAHIRATGGRVSRRNLRAAGVHASNAELGALATNLTSPTTTGPRQPATTSGL
jgi:hypothetical protein